MRPAFDYDGSAVYNIDARDLPSVLDGPVDAVVTDPPYELGLGTAGETARWDSTGIAFDPDFWRAILGVMRPGAFLFAFGSPRTWHRLACAVEDAGFLIRDQLCWLYASGMPKGEWGDHAVDRALGVSDPRASREAGSASLRGRRLKEGAYEPATPEAARWTGFNPALKPAWEPVIVAQRPREAMLGRNLLDHGTGALDVAAAAVPADMAELGRRYERNSRLRDGDPRGGDVMRDTATPRPAAPRLDGRYPSDLILDPRLERLLPEGVPPFYFCPKASGADRPVVADAPMRRPAAGWPEQAARLGLRPDAPEVPASLLDAEAMACTTDAGVRRLAHPTVKPASLMCWLVRLSCRPGGLILDPFLGSGSTMAAARIEGRRCVGSELDTSYLPLIDARVRSTAAFDPLF